MFYNLDMILAVGYRTNSKNAIKFRQWTTARLKEYLVQGYSINQSRLDKLKKSPLNLLIAQSDPKEKEMMIKLVVNLINQG